MNVRKILNCISIIMFFAVTAMIGVSTAFFQKNISFEEARGQSASFADAIEIYLDENFPFRKNWQSLYAKTALAMGKCDFSGVYYDKSHERLISVFSEYDEERVADNAEMINVFHSRYSNVPACVMLVPTASGIYRADLPDSAGATDQQKLIDDVYYAIDEKVASLDVYNALYSLRDNYIYFRTEPYWTQLGAYEAYAASAAKLGFSPYTIANYDMDYTHVYFTGKLSEQSGIVSVPEDTVEAFKCKYGSYVKSTKLLREKQVYTKTSVYSNSGLRSDDKYAYFLGADNFKCAQIETTNESAPSILVIGSDYANCFVPFLAPHCSRITLVNPERLADGELLRDIADPSEYDRILILYDIESFCETESLSKLVG